MHVMVLGLRGFPDVQGGVETHAQHLYPLLVKLGCKVDVLVRSPYMSPRVDSFEGVSFRRLWSPRKSGVEAIVHSIIGVLYAAFIRPDVLHIHAIGPSIVTPLARMLGLRVVVTHHGPDYDRDKWGIVARRVLLMGEALGMRFSNQRIVISDVIRELVRKKYGCDSILIYNGVTLPEVPVTTAALDNFGIAPGRYILQVSRFVPEKRQIDLMRAFSMADLEGWKLVLVGELESGDEYCDRVRELARDLPNVIITGFQTGIALQEIFANAGGFVLPSTHEGLPIALLEALSYGLPVLASDISANLELGLPETQYFPVGEIAELASGLVRLANLEYDEQVKMEIRGHLKERYNWSTIAEQTLAVYESV